MIKSQLLIPYLIVSPLQRMQKIVDDLVILFELRENAEMLHDETSIRAIDVNIYLLTTEYQSIKHTAN